MIKNFCDICEKQSFSQKITGKVNGRVVIEVTTPGDLCGNCLKNHLTKIVNELNDYKGGFIEL